MKWIACDLDGTVADCDHRLKHILDMETGEKLKKANYDLFFKNCIEDKPIKDMINLVKGYSMNAHSIVFITGRPERMMEETCQWIEKHITDDFCIYMRRDSDYRPDFITKAELMHEAIVKFGSEPVAFMEDKKPVFDEWANIAPMAMKYYCGRK